MLGETEIYSIKQDFRVPLVDRDEISKIRGSLSLHHVIEGTHEIFEIQSVYFQLRGFPQAFSLSAFVPECLDGFVYQWGQIFGDGSEFQRSQFIQY